MYLYCRQKTVSPACDSGGQTAFGPQDSPRSNGCVTHAAMELADPPNQKGYRIEGPWLCLFCLGAKACLAGAEAAAAASFSGCISRGQYYCDITSRRKVGKPRLNSCKTIETERDRG